MTDLLYELSNFQTSFNTVLHSYLKDRLRKTKNKNFRQFLQIQNKYLTSGGKRLRPFLSSIFYEAQKGYYPNPQWLIPLELVHQFLLIHDDIIDNCKLRYGKPNLWGLFERLGKHYQKIDSEHFGLSLSLISADLVLNEAIDYVNSLNLADDTGKKLIALISETINKTIEGWHLQYLDTAGSLKSASSDKFTKQNLLVSSFYSFFFPIKYAAVLADKKIDNKKIIEFTNPLGLAYQIHDDYLGLFGNQKVVGKPITSDIAEAKKTLFVIKAYKLLGKKDKKFLAAHLGKKINNKDFKKIKKLIETSGALKYCLDYEEKLTKESLKKLDNLNFKKSFTKKISLLISYLTTRQF